MTTATDWDDATWTDTGEMAAVTDVTSAAVDGAMVDVHRMADQLARVQRRADMLAAENAELRKRLGGWTPPQPQRVINGESDLSPHERMCATSPPTAAYLHSRGNTIAAEMVRGIDRTPGWPTWLGDVHHADAEWADIVARLRAMPDTYKAPPIERTVIERVEISDEYTEKRLAAELQYRGLKSAPSVYEQLGPDQINEGQPPNPITPDAEMKGSANSDGSTHNSGHDAVTTPPPDDRVQRMTRRVNGRPTSQPETPAETPAPRRPWWRSEWVAGAGVVVVWAAAIGALVVLA